MSPRAAWRLDGMGFERVYDYVPGKADWSANGLPTEGKLAGVPTVGGAARRDVPTCVPEETVGEARDRARELGWNTCVVVNKERVVLGLLRGKELASEPGVHVERVMRNGPTTYRANVPVEKAQKRMQDRGASEVPVTTPDGRLVGLLALVQER